MRALAYDTPHDLANFQMTERQLPDPVLKPHDVLVRVKAFSVNPVDYKQRQKRAGIDGRPVILGWDAAGVIEQVGPDVQGFAVGDAVYYAGDLKRDGSYAELQAVDHRLIAKKPDNLSFAESAAVPLTALTAWEALFERGISYKPETKVLIIGGAGGVGSMAIQLLKAHTAATVIATASRPDTVAWCKSLGADHIIGRDLVAGLADLGITDVDVVFGTTHTPDYVAIIPDLLRPFGHFSVIDDPQAFDIRHFKSKALSIHWELMFTKSLYGYDLSSQGVFLSRLAGWLKAGTVRSTLALTLPATPESIRQAHSFLEAGSSLGKIVLEW